MCGIVGFLGVAGSLGERRHRLEAMNATIVHRGPDSAGFHLDDDVGLAMRRLSIIDLKHGAQPMAGRGGRLWLVFNGEVYNHADIRRDLAGRGVGFTTRSDTEALLRALERDGADAVHRLNGMFAFAAWDADRRALLLARDRMGVKPLYYYWDGRVLAFASEIKALLASGLVRREIEPQALWDYLTLRYVPQPLTIWRNVFKLPPAHRLVARPGEAPVVERYWDIPYDEPVFSAPTDERAMEAEFAALFEDSVRLRLVADVRVGITLSGGLDSSAVAAVAARSGTIETFSIGFDEPGGPNELPHAQRVADHLGATHHAIVIGEREFRDFLPRFVHFTDEPMADPASIPLFYLCRLAAERVKVVLSGEGSDEILAGYDFERRFARWNRGGVWPMVRQLLRRPAVLGALGIVAPDRAARMAAQAMPVDLREGTPPNMTNFMSAVEKAALLADGGAGNRDSLGGLRDALRRLGRQHPLHQTLYAYCQDWLVEDLLMKADRMSMANSVELRTPFLDYRLVEWAARAPLSAKIGRGSHGLVTKRVLRRYAAAHLPREVIDRPKEGFPVPVTGWLATRWRGWAEELVGSPSSRLCSFMDGEVLAACVRRGTMVDATARHSHVLWNLCVLETWMQEWLPAHPRLAPLQPDAQEQVH